MSRNVLIALAALTVLLIGGAVAWKLFGAQGAEDGGRSRIVIVTDGMLANLATADDVAAYRQLQLAAVSFGTIGSGGGVQTSVAAAAGNQSETQPDSTPQTNSPNGLDALTVRNLIADQLEAQLSGALTDSERFSVADPATLRPILRRLTMEEHPSQSTDNKTAQAPQPRTVAEQVGHEVVQITTAGTQLTAADPTQNEDLAGAARELGVRYLLAVIMQEPHYTITYSAESLHIEADPTFVYRLYDVNNTRTVMSGVARMNSPIIVEIAWALIGADVRDLTGQARTTAINASIAAHIARAGQEAGLDLQREVARQVADRVLDRVFPASIVQVNPVTITRGSNDGYQAGDNLQIIRRDLAHPVRDRGVIIDHPESVVGGGRVDRVQSNSATIQLASGVAIDSEKLEEYVVRRADESAGAGAEQNGVPSGVGLGVADIAQQSGPAEAISASVAVGLVTELFDGNQPTPSNWSPVEQALQGRLSQDRRIVVLSRQGLDELRREQSIGDSGRRSYRVGGGAMARAGFLVLGDVTYSTQRVAQTISAGNVSREVSAQWYLNSRGHLRIEAINSRLVAAVEIASRTPISSGRPSLADYQKAQDGYAAAAAQEILPRLFPIEVVDIQGGAIVLSRGADIGVHVGDRVMLYRLGAPIIDRTTHRQISAGARTRVAEVRIDDVQDTVSTASVIGTGSPEIGNIGELGGAPAAQSGASRSSARQTQSVEASAPW